MAILLLLGNPFVRGGTNSPPPLILKGQPNTNSAAQRWSPWSCWWLMPASNAPVRTDLSEADIAESGVSNKLAEASTPGSEMTNAVSDLTQTNADVSSNDRSFIDFGARVISGRPIGHRNVEIGQQNVKIGQAAAQLGPNNTQLGQGQLTGPSLTSPASTGSIGKPGAGVPQSPTFSQRSTP
jgi:hypothetical protein